MYEDVIELLVQAGLLTAYAALTGLLAVVGAFVEYNGFVNAVEGQYLMALWLACIGAVVLYFGVLICRRKLLVQYSRLAALAGN